MDAKEYLLQLRQLDNYIRQNQEMLDELRQEASGIDSINYSRQRVKTGASVRSPAEDAAMKLHELSCTLRKEIAEYANLKRLIISQIRSLENEAYSRVLYKRYVEYKPLEAIADEMGYSYAYTRHLHGWALKEFGEKYLK